MSDSITRVLDDCHRYWVSTGIAQHDADEMRHELSQHLRDAETNGRSPASVVGSHPARFAEEWATERRQGRSRPESTTRLWRDITSGALDTRRDQRRASILYGLGAATLIAGVLVGSTLSKGGDTVELETFRWFWTVLAVVAGIAEIFTAGFFLLPISIGAVGAAVLAWLGVDPIAQWLVFFGVTAIAFGYLRRFAHSQDAFQPRVGANRWVGARGIVIETIDPDTGRGMVRVDGEEWRATSGSGVIAAGAKVAVSEVTGSRMVVVPIEPS